MSPATGSLTSAVLDTVSLKCITLPNVVALTVTVVTSPPLVVTPTVMPLEEDEDVPPRAAIEVAISLWAISLTVFPPIVRVSAETVVALNVAVLVTVRFVKEPVVAVTTLSPDPL